MLLAGADLRLNVVADGNFAPNQNINEGRGRLCFHHIVGSIPVAEGVWSTPGSQRSAHTGNDFDGRLIQWLDTRHVAYAQCAGNWHGWTSMECASDPNANDSGPTRAQILTIANAAAQLGCPPRQAQSMDDYGIAYHRLFPGACQSYFGQTACPGDGFAAALDDVIAAMQGQLPGAPGEDDMPQISYIVKRSDGSLGIWAYDEMTARHILPVEWGAIAYAHGGAPPVKPLPDDWWDSIPKMLPTGDKSTLTLQDLVNVRNVVKAP